MERIDLKKTNYSKNQYKKVIDTNFTQLTLSPSLQVALSPQPAPAISIDAFFSNYEKIFFDIPKFGETNSHEFLIKQSSEYVGDDSVNADYQALIDEINALQQQILDLNQQIVDLTTSSTNGRTNS